MLKGFAPIFLIIPLIFVSLITVTAVSLKAKPITSADKPRPISRSILDSASPSPIAQNSPEELPIQPPSPPTEAPTPIPDSERTIEFQTFAKEAPSPSPSPSPKLKPAASSQSSTSSGANYTVATFNLSSTTVITDTANDNDCPNDCPTKPLAQYISENGGRAGINGSYFCPPDYANCAGKVNSFDFSVWNNRHKKWINASTLFWGGRGMMIFRPGSAQFFPCASCAGAPSDITGGITNYPSLLSGGQVIVSDGAKGTRGGIGFGNDKLFLVVARGSSYYDLANIFKNLGATDALNLDGGGSTALYDGRYKAGPGRSLPNAIVVK